MGLFSRKPKQKNPEELLPELFSNAGEKLFSELSNEIYQWNKSYGKKKFESFVLSRFVFNYAFKKEFDEQLSEDEKSAFTFYSDKLFIDNFNNFFSTVNLEYSHVEEVINEKVDQYQNIRLEHKPPHCWIEIFRAVTQSDDVESLKLKLKEYDDGMKVVQNNPNFSHLTPYYTSKLKETKSKLEGLESADLVLSGALRPLRDKLKSMHFKKLKKMLKKIQKEMKKAESKK